MRNFIITITWNITCSKYDFRYDKNGISHCKLSSKTGLLILYRKLTASKLSELGSKINIQQI